MRRYRFDNFELDEKTGQVTRDGEYVSIPPQAALLLLLGMQRAGQLVSREDAINALWRPSGRYAVSDYSLDLNKLVYQLRRALDDDVSHPRYWETIPRWGWRFLGQVEVIEPAAIPRAAPAVPDASQQMRLAVLLLGPAVTGLEAAGVPIGPLMGSAAVDWAAVAAIFRQPAAAEGSAEDEEENP